MKQNRSMILTISYGLIIAFLLYFVALPIVSVVIYGFGAENSLLSNLKGIERSLGYLKNSIVVSVTVTAFATVIGLVMSFTLNRVAFMGRRIMKILVLLPFVNPPFVGSISYIMLFGKRGLITHQLLGLTISPFGLQGILIIQILSLSSHAYLLISSSIRKIDVTLEDAARNLGATEGNVFRTITVPMMRPEILGTALLIFLESMADFSTPLVIGGSYQTLASDLYIQITGLYNMTSATLSGIILLIPCVGIFILHKYYFSKHSYFSEDHISLDIEYKHIGKKTKIFLVTFCGIFISFVLAKYLFIIIGALTKSWGHDYTFTLEHVKALGGRKYKPFVNSFKLATISALIASGTGVTLAYLIKVKQLKFSGMVDFLATVPAAIPGILFGISYLVTFKYPLFGIGRLWLTDTKGIVLMGSSVIIYLICIARFMNTGLRSGYALFEHIHPDIEKASYNLGASVAQTFIKIIIPLMKDAFSASFLKSFSSGMVTLGAIILLLIPSNKVAVQQVFQIITSSDTGNAAAMALMLSLMTFIFMSGYYVLFNAKELISRSVAIGRRK